MTAAPDIFLSYNREDQAVAKRYADAFAAEGLNVWWDTALRSGEAYDEVTEAALRGAKAVVVLWSPRSVVSRWVRAEATLADRAKTLVPVRIEACDLPIMFELTQTADLSHWRGAKGDPAWQALLNDVRRKVGSEAGSTGADSMVATAPASAERESFIPAIAVLPVATRQGDTDEDAAFAADLTDELLTALSACSTFRILPAGMSATWRSNLTDLRPLAEELGARYLLESTLRRTGDGFRIATKLIEGASAKVLWSQKFARPLCDLEDVPDALAGEIAIQANDRTNYLEFELAEAKTQNLTAWDHYCRAVNQTIKTTNASLQLATKEAYAALALAPGWNLAHAGLAVNLALTTVFSGDKDGSKAAEAKSHIQAALTQNINNPAVLLLVGGACNWLGDPATGLRYIERSFALNPHQTAIHFHLEVSNVFLGRLAEGLAEFDKHIALATSDQITGWACMYQSMAYHLGGENALASAAIERSLHYIPNADSFLIWPAAIAALCGTKELARSRLAKLRNHVPEFTIDTGLAQLALFLMSNEDKAQAAQATLTQLWTEAGGSA